MKTIDDLYLYMIVAAASSMLITGLILAFVKAPAEIAKQADMTTDEFHRYFREVIGEEFRSWRVRRRIDEAKLLIREHPELTMTQIAKMCGFNDRSFFYQQFRRYAGISITEYRNQKD